MRQAIRKITIGVLGGIVLLAGILMIFLPGPAIIVIPAGLAILATEFEWAQRYLARVKHWVHRMKMRRAARKGAKQRALADQRLRQS